MILVYNGLGQRVEKVAPTETTRYIYDEERLLQETDGNDEMQKEFTFAAEQYGQLVSEFGADEGQSSFYLYDGQWSTNALLDPDQNATDRFRYRAFGLETAGNNSDQTNLTFVGKQGYYRDAETELYFLGMAGNSTRQGGRFYDPAAGRFVTPDPIKLDAGDLNVYRYVQNNPINAVDPSGLESADPCDIDDAYGLIRVGGVMRWSELANLDTAVRLKSLRSLAEIRIRFGNADWTCSHSPSTMPRSLPKESGRPIA